MNPQISIIIPIYKIKEKYLRKAIESAIYQTLKNIEIILVDDGSPDCCPFICDEYAEKDIRIKVIHKKNGGLASARNAGILNAQGEYIMFLDGDDYLSFDVCKKAYNEAKIKNCDMVLFGLVREYPSHSENIDNSKYFMKQNFFAGDEIQNLRIMVLNYNASVASSVGKLIKRSIVKNNVIMFDEYLKQGAEGIEFCFRLYKQIHSAYIMYDYFGYHYVYNSDSITNNFEKSNAILAIKSFIKIKKEIDEETDADKYLPYYYNRLQYLIITTTISGFFNPYNTQTYKKKCGELKKYLKIPLVEEALCYRDIVGINMQRKIVLFLIKRKFYWGLALLGRIRRIQKAN